MFPSPVLDRTRWEAHPACAVRIGCRHRVSRPLTGLRAAREARLPSLHLTAELVAMQYDSERSFLETSFLPLRRERYAKGLTQEDLADRAGLSARYLGSIERGTVSASVTVLGRLAQALRIDPCDLIRRGQRR